MAYPAWAYIDELDQKVDKKIKKLEKQIELLEKRLVLMEARNARLNRALSHTRRRR